MSKSGTTYKATGITLKSMPMGESDRLLTILTKEHGLVRAVTPGARKPKSSLRAISTAFVVGELLIVKGRNLDKLVQADCRASFPGLSRDLGKLTAAQYLAELVLRQALSQNPQEELFEALNQHLGYLAQRSPDQTLPSLVQGIVHFLTLAGIAPQVQHCCLTQQPLTPNFADPAWRVGFDASAGGAIALPNQAARSYTVQSIPTPPRASSTRVAETPSGYGSQSSRSVPRPILKKNPRRLQLNAAELAVLQQLSLPNSSAPSDWPPNLAMLNRVNAPGDDADDDTPPDSWPSISTWLSLERTLRYYTQYHFDQPIRSAALIETCFLETMG